MCHLREGLPDWVIPSQYCYGAFVYRITTISGGPWVQAVDGRRLKSTNEGSYCIGLDNQYSDGINPIIQLFLPAISGHVPTKMVRAVSAFTEFCYLARRSQIDETILTLIDTAIERFHREREIFIEVNVREDFSLPRQHSLVHYSSLIRLFGAPNGICSSITESKHIQAVKEPWRRSNHNKPLGQILLTNQRLDKLAAARVDFESRKMLDQRSILQGVPPSSPPLALNKDDDEAVDTPGTTVLGDVKLAVRPGECHLVLVQYFVYVR